LIGIRLRSFETGDAAREPVAAFTAAEQVD
jgi:hypothetical protein